MTDRKPSYEELKDRLKKAEKLIQILENYGTSREDWQVSQLRRLANKLIRAERDERRNLSAILHDHIQPLIVGARMQVWEIQRNSDTAVVKKTADRVESILVETLAALRSLSAELRPAPLQHNGLSGGLDWLKRYMSDQFEFGVNLTISGDIDPIREETGFLLYEGVKELLLNAAKHADVDQADVLVRRTRENTIHLVVSDRGQGFDPDISSQRETATLGLFSIQERLASISGSMLIETAPGRGTKVTLTVPAGMERQENPPSAAKEKTSAFGLKKTGSLNIKKEMIGILIVDDHKVLREGLNGLLGAEPDFHVLGEAASGSRAIDRALELRPDVIIMDVNLGDMDGVRATREILSREPGIRVIALSMYDDQSLVEEILKAGAVQYLTKSASSDDIISAIRDCICIPDTGV